MFKRTFLVGVAVSALTIGLTFIAEAQAGTFNQVAIHPEVAAQPTARGNRIATLEPFNGKLYAGYGDYGANTGPIAIRAYDPAIGDFTASLLSMANEAVYIYRELGGKMYAPNIDTRGANSGYAVGTAGNPDTWQDRLPVAGIHMFDINMYGGDLYMAGVHNNGDGGVWRSSDNGATWTESLRMPAGVGGKGQTQNIDVRIYGLGVYQGKLYADVDQLYTTGAAIGARSGGQSAPSMVFDGSTWTEGPKLTPYGFANNMTEFAGALIYQDFHPGIGGSELFAYDGKRITQAYNPKGRNATTDFLFDFTVASDVLYALTTDNHIVMTSDLNSWSLLDTAPAGSTSIGVLNDALYLGAVGGLLYEYDTLLSALPAPTLLTTSGAFTELSTSLGNVPEPASAVAFIGGITLLATRRRVMR